LYWSGVLQSCACKSKANLQKRLENLNARRSGRFSFEIHIMADVFSLLMLRRMFKACSFTTLCATGKAFSRF
jgi:hypothetical protein